MQNPDRRLAAIMFTDIVGYTRMAQAKEALALELLEEHRAVVRGVLSAHGGIEIKTIGDAFLVEFRSALEAVLCAVDIQNKMDERNSKVPGERRVEMRIGVHLGDVVHGSGDVYGDAVNVASRIEPLAQSGGICISQQVFDNIRNKSGLTIVGMGEVELKNVELPMAVYRVEMNANRTPPANPGAPRERLAVLPFVNISPDPNDEYFADGLTEELITKLSEIKGLKVIARTSVMNYKRKEKSISQIGRELEAGSIIEGSVRKAGRKIRVAVQLIDSRTEEHLWASNYDKELDDIFAIQSDVASKVAGSVSAGLLAPSTPREVVDVEAYTLYLKASQLIHEATEPAMREGIALLEKAIAKAPRFARAYAALGKAWCAMSSSGYEDYDVTEARAEPLVRKALELDPESSEALAAMAGISNLLDRWDILKTEAEIAVKLNPNLAGGHTALGIAAAARGNLEEGLAYLEKAHELDPLEAYGADLLARTARVAGKNDRALEVLNRMNELSPSVPRILSGLAESYMNTGDFEKAQKFIDEGLKVNPREPLLLLNQGVLYALTGRRHEAERALADMMTLKSEAVRLYGRLFINAALGNLDQAFDALTKAAELHSWPYLVGSLPIFVGLRKDERYRVFAARVGIPAQS